MPAVFEKLGVRFEYPDSWEIDEEEARESGDTITVYSPGGAFWSLNIQPPMASVTELTASAIEAMKAEYDELDANPVTKTVDGTELDGYEMNFYCLDLTNTARILTVQQTHATYVIMCQAEDRELDVTSAVFDAITASLLR